MLKTALSNAAGYQWDVYSPSDPTGDALPRLGVGREEMAGVMSKDEEPVSDGIFCANQSPCLQFCRWTLSPAGAPEGWLTSPMERDGGREREGLRKKEVKGKKEGRKKERGGVNLYIPLF